MKALLVVDIQNDFLPGGALGVKGGDEVIPAINRLLDLNFDVIVASKDWHPENHCSFARTQAKQPGDHVNLRGLDQILWPVHCVQNTLGAKLSSRLDRTRIEKMFFKGTDPAIDSYSAFFDNGHQKATGLGEYLQEKKVTDLWIAGLTTEYCVKYSVLDASRLGLKTHVVLDACRPVNLLEGDEERAIEEMRRVGAEITSTEAVLSQFARSEEE